jgi:large subunit ribosomal protein L6
MSRIGRMPINIPDKVKVEVIGAKVQVSGPQGNLSLNVKPEIKVTLANNIVNIARSNEEKHTRQLHGTTRANIAAMIEGVSKGFKKQLVINGIGFKAQLQGKNIQLNVGYTHPVIIVAKPNTKIEVPAPTEITVSGCDKQAVGEVAALIRNTRLPEPYLGKGISYKGERIRRKEGKKAGK